jgi:hypothetical protein
VSRTGALYEELLLDLDRLLAIDSAFLLGPWLASARKLGPGRRRHGLHRHDRG